MATLTPRVSEESILLRSMQVLRAQTETTPEQLLDRRILPKGYLTWLCREIGALSLWVYFFDTSGRLVLFLRRGPHVPGIAIANGADPKVVNDLVGGLRRDQVCTFEFKSKHRRRHGLAPSFGYIVAYHATAWSSQQRGLIEAVGQLIQEYVLLRERLFALSRAERSLRAVRDLRGLFPTTGTRLAASIRHLCQGVAAGFGAFSLLRRGELHTIYRRVPGYEGNARAIEPPTVIGIDEIDSLNVLKRGEVLEGSTAREAVRWLREALGIDELAGTRPFWLCASPVRVDGDVIALFSVAISGYLAEVDQQSARQLVKLAAEELQPEAISTYTRLTPDMIVEPVFRSRAADVQPDLAFTLMPFGEEWSDRIWQRQIKPICERNGLTAMRADDLFGRDIMEDIWLNICRARIVIADITARNANVFYELGMAHTLGKPVVLLTQSVTDIPFDLNRFRHIVYADNADGYDKLARELSGTIKEMLG